MRKQSGAVGKSELGLRPTWLQIQALRVTLAGADCITVCLKSWEADLFLLG